MNKQQYILKWHKFQQRYENMYVPKFRDALQEQVQALIHRAGKQASIATWLASLNVIRPKPIEDVLIELYQQVGPLWAQYTGIHKLPKVEKKGARPMGFNERIVQLMREYYGIDLFLDAVTITDNTKKYISEVLSQASELGWSFDDIVKRLTTMPELTAMRARRIARTETVTAANGAALINAKDSKLLMDKKWISVKDKRTRHSHRDEDGKTVGLDDPFIVGPEKTEMQAPGVRQQPDGEAVPLREFINCRCTVAFIAKRDSNGRLVKKTV